MAAVENSGIQLQRRQLLGAAIAAAGLASAGGALAQPDLVDMQIVDRAGGQPLQVWRRNGRLFVAGEPGRRYAVRVTNRTAGRVMAVMSVDGLNILSGERASYGQNGYVLDPFQSYDAAGWRKSDDEVAAFSFAPLPQSYAARTGRPDDVGVIGMAVFRERPLLEPLHAEPPRLVRPPPADRSVNEVVVTSPRIARSGAASSPPDEKLGTAHGEREWSQVHEVNFIRATPYPQTIRQIEYDSYDNLLASGVIPRGPREDHRPRAFPSQPHGDGYVPDPPDER